MIVMPINGRADQRKPSSARTIRVSTTETSTEPRQPSLLEKSRNMEVATPQEQLGSPRGRRHERRVRSLYLVLGLTAVALGVIGLFLPILPTVPFMLLAAFFFARSNPAWEQRILNHPRFGPPIRAWRERGAISRPAKAAALVALAGSAGMGLWLLPEPWRYLPLAIAMTCGAWIATRPS
jgi:uncharacterized protein